MADILVTAAYLLMLVLPFMRFQPGFVGVMLGDPRVSVRWAWRVSRRYAARMFGIAALLGLPFLLLRQTLTVLCGGDALAVALTDGLVSTVMMLMLSVTYQRIYERISSNA